ncbi:FTR1 family protein [Paenibacillus aurantius]|uniref:FTR1 family protein n=1 Tax=Paenibacillus aurantius TaxID=2918900 RepID=A0AA96RHA7_9BACL|nr:FTR1 family protein [Paenibacillus aurantius]WNQ10919.1 FTR1 family protein [Paenibacillus aurantius]
MNRQGYPLRSVVLLLALLLGLAGGSAAAVPAAAAGTDGLMPAAGGALVHTTQKEWPEAGRELERFEAEWKAVHAPASPQADQVNAALTAAKAALSRPEADPGAAYKAVSALTKAADAFVKAAETASGSAKGGGPAAAKELLPVLQRMQEAAGNGQAEQARAEFRRFDAQWAKAEPAIRADSVPVYGRLETLLTMARISLQAEPFRAEAAASAIGELRQTVEGYSAGTLAEAAPEAAADGRTVDDALLLLEKAQQAIGSGQPAAAAERMQAFIRLWPSVEGAVLTRAPDVYTAIENRMAEASGDLLSSPPKTEAASRVIEAMRADLEPYRGSVRYTAWDAALILLREGLEALLVLAALLAFLQRSGHSGRQRWVWGGAAAGLVLSAGLAGILTYAVASAAAGGARETMEGVTGLVSVVMMITVGAWLHGKAQVQTWNRYIQNQVGAALAGGSLWSLFAVACLSILREGAETAIFYVGMAPSIDPMQMLTGIAGALAALVVLGWIVVKASVRLPVRPFFLTASLLIYYLVIKFLGQSLHALQVAGPLPATPSAGLPFWEWLGVYPTWETTVPQLAVLAFLAFSFIRTEKKKAAVGGKEAPSRV